MAESESPLYAYGAAAVLGVVSHIGYFNRSEHHLHGTRYLQLFLLTYATTVFVLARTASPTSFDFHALLPAARSATALAASFLAGLYTSLLTYRLTPLHPLHRFPGPVLARATSLWLPFNVWHKFTPSHSSTTHTIPQAFKTLSALHATHGPYVRVGTAELSIADPSAVPLIYGGTSTCSKAPWYDNDAPLTSMQTSRDRGYHDARRRVWAKAFAERAVRGFEERVQSFVGVLIGRLGEVGEGGKKEVDARKWFGWFAYDIMGEMAFGREFGMVRGGQEHWAIGLLNEGMMPLGLLCESLSLSFPSFCLAGRLFVPVGLGSVWLFALSWPADCVCEIDFCADGKFLIRQCRRGLSASWLPSLAPPLTTGSSSRTARASWTSV